MGVRVLVGTAKGGFWLTSADRRAWQLSDPLFRGWKVTAATRLEDGRYLLAVASDIYGPALQIGRGSEWRQIEHGPAYPDGGDLRLKQIWTLQTRGSEIYAGVEHAGIFRSRDAGETWEPLEGLNGHPTRSGWIPGAGGMCAHAILFDPNDSDRMWCGISAVGVFRSDDGGETWHPRNEGVPMVLEDLEHKEIGRCVHGLAQDPTDPDRIYRQDHRGMFRSADGGDTWHANDEGLPSGFGFPIVVDRPTTTLFAVPQVSDQYRLPHDGALRVFRSTDRGDSWHSASTGLQTESFFGTVLRGAMSVDDLEPGGVYFGTTAGTVHVSADLGDSWQTLPTNLPRVFHVSAWAE